MKIFISWSGDRSRAVAEALNDWLKRVIQAVKPFYSPDIEKGAKWSSEVANALEGTRFGIVCLTPDNLKSTWVHYETGALSKTPDAVIWTFLHGIEPGDVPQPLGQFMATESEKKDVLKMLQAINKRLAEVGGEPIDSTVLNENFEMYWPRLEERLKSAEDKTIKIDLAKDEKGESQRNEREILLEILEIARGLQRPKTTESTLPYEERHRIASDLVQSLRLKMPIIPISVASKITEAIESTYENVWVKFSSNGGKSYVKVYVRPPFSLSQFEQILETIKNIVPDTEIEIINPN